MRTAIPLGPFPLYTFLLSTPVDKKRDEVHFQVAILSLFSLTVRTGESPAHLSVKPLFLDSPVAYRPFFFLFIFEALDSSALEADKKLLDVMNHGPAIVSLAPHSLRGNV